MADARSWERASPGVGTYICTFCQLSSVSLAAIRDHLESSHRDRVITDEDFISSVIYRASSSSTTNTSAEVSQPSPSSADGRKKSSTIRCKLCGDSFLEDKEYLRHLKSCRASSNPVLKGPSRKTGTRSAPRGRIARGGKSKTAPLVEPQKSRRGSRRSRGRGAGGTVAMDRQTAKKRREKSSKVGENSAMVSSHTSTALGSNGNSPHGSNGRSVPSTSQLYSTFSSSDSPLPYCSLCDRQFSMQTTYQIHVESKEHKAQELIKAERERRKNRVYSCSLCPDEGPWNHKRHLKQHVHTNMHKMAKKVEAMISRIFTDQPFDENLQELQESLMDQSQSSERGKDGVVEGSKVDSDDDDYTTTSSSSIPSPSAVTTFQEAHGHKDKVDTRNQAGQFHNRSPAEISEFVRKMLEPAKDLFLPPPPTRRQPEFSASGFRVPNMLTILNDEPNRLISTNLDLDRPMHQLATVSGERLRSPNALDTKLEAWQEVVQLVRKVASLEPSFHF